MNHCVKCGAPLPPGAEFCPRCGTPVNVLPAHVVAGPKTRIWWIIPLTLLVVGGVVWLLLAGLPFGGGEERPAVTRAATETIAEGTSTAPNRPIETGTVVDVPAAGDDEDLTPAEPPRVIEDTAPPPPREEPEAPPPAREITPAQADAILRGYVTSTRYYRLGPECVRIQNRGYRNVGYALEVWNTCGPASRLLGRWRVDAKTREVFVQRDDGRYLRP